MSIKTGGFPGSIFCCKISDCIIRQNLIVNQIMQEEKVHLKYDECQPPVHMLKHEDFADFELSQDMMNKLPSEGLTLKYDNHGQFIAVGLKNGMKLLYDINEGKVVNRVEDVRQNSITSIKWRPTKDQSKKILLTGDAGGYVSFWHVPTLKLIFSILQHENSVHTVDFSTTGKNFATGGKDFHIRIYDQETKSLTTDLKPAGWNNVGHDNRVFAVKYLDDHTIISGGWDSVVHIWDLRQGKSAKHFYGPNISGQSLDFENGKILAGCYLAKDQVQLWDYGTLKKVQNIDWTGNIDDAQYVYAAGFSRRNPDIFGAGTTGAKSQVRLYKENQAGKFEKTNSITGLPQGCFSLDFSHKKEQFAFTTPHHGFYVYSYNKK